MCRAILSPARVILVDEATANVDAATDLQVQKVRPEKLGLSSLCCQVSLRFPGQFEKIVRKIQIKFCIIIWKCLGRKYFILRPNFQHEKLTSCPRLQTAPEKSKNSLKMFTGPFVFHFCPQIGVSRALLPPKFLGEKIFFLRFWVIKQNFRCYQQII